MSRQEPRSQRKRPRSGLRESSLRERPFFGILSLSPEPRTWEVQSWRSGGERWCYDLRSASQPASQTSKQVPWGATEQGVVPHTPEGPGSPTARGADRPCTPGEPGCLLPSGGASRHCTLPTVALGPFWKHSTGFFSIV